MELDKHDGEEQHVSTTAGTTTAIHVDDSVLWAMTHFLVQEGRLRDQGPVGGGTEAGACSCELRECGHATVPTRHRCACSFCPGVLHSACVTEQAAASMGVQSYPTPSWVGTRGRTEVPWRVGDLWVCPTCFVGAPSVS